MAGVVVVEVDHISTSSVTCWELAMVICAIVEDINDVICGNSR